MAFRPIAASLWKADSRTMRPDELLAKLYGRRPRFIHIDGEHSRAALTKDLELATAVSRPRVSSCSMTCCIPATPR